jgi:hypothetical protein
MLAMMAMPVERIDLRTLPPREISRSHIVQGLNATTT